MTENQGKENHNPRKEFEQAIQYAVQLASGYINLFKSRNIDLTGLNYLEIGPGADFAPQLVLASHGVNVFLADKYIANWDPEYHPYFYKEFVRAWPGKTDHIEKAISQGGYDGLLTFHSEAAENLESIRSNSIDFVQSNAVLEHVVDIQITAKELARVTKTGGIHAHQIDLRDHRDFNSPLGHLLTPPAEYYKRRIAFGGVHGTSLRMPEIIDLFSKDFWIWDIEANYFADENHLSNVIKNLPSDSPYLNWPRQLLRETSGRLWLVKK